MSRPRRYTEGTSYSFSTHEEGITAPDNLYDPSFSAIDLLRNNNLLSQWRKILSGWERFVEENYTEARALVRRGIPAEIRGEAWKIISGGDGLKSKNPGVYESLVSQKSASENCLKKDITRTYPTNKHFRVRGGEGQKALYNVLKVYSIMDPEVGYCQGMSFLCGVLVFHLNEVDAFWVLSAMLKGMGPPLRLLFTDGLPLLKKYIFRFSHLFHAFMPGLHNQFTNLGINPLFYSAEWFTTVFSYSTPIPVTARIWDVILFEGPDYLLALALAVIKQSEADLMDMPFDTTVSYLKQKTQSLNVSIIEEADKFIKQIPNLLKDIDRLYEASLNPPPSPRKPVVRAKDYQPPALPPRKSARNSIDSGAGSPLGSARNSKDKEDQEQMAIKVSKKLEQIRLIDEKNKPTKPQEPTATVEGSVVVEKPTLTDKKKTEDVIDSQVTTQTDKKNHDSVPHQGDELGIPSDANFQEEGSSQEQDGEEESFEDIQKRLESDTREWLRSKIGDETLIDRVVITNTHTQ